MKKPLPLRPENNHLKYIFIIVRQNMFVHLQNLFFCKISKFPRRILNCQKYSMNRAYTITVPEWTDTEENPNPTGNEYELLDFWRLLPQIYYQFTSLGLGIKITDNRLGTICKEQGMIDVPFPFCHCCVYHCRKIRHNKIKI